MGGRKREGAVGVARTPRNECCISYDMQNLNEDGTVAKLFAAGETSPESYSHHWRHCSSYHLHQGLHLRCVTRTSQRDRCNSYAAPIGQPASQAFNTQLPRRHTARDEGSCDESEGSEIHAAEVQ